MLILERANNEIISFFITAIIAVCEKEELMMPPVF